MDMTTLLIIVVVVLLLGGGGFMAGDAGTKAGVLVRWLEITPQEYGNSIKGE